MSDTEDIVVRLRMLGGLDAALCNKAADEIGRLRAERDEYKDAFEFAHKEFHDALDDLAKMKAERDEARWRLCKVVGDNRDMWGEDVAKEYGWDYLKEEK
jgi:hypothetical protein